MARIIFRQSRATFTTVTRSRTRLWLAGVILMACGTTLGCAIAPRGARLFQHCHAVESVAFGERNGLVATTARDGIVGLCTTDGHGPPRVFTVSESGITPQFDLPTPSALHAIFAPDNKHLLVVAHGASGEVRRWSLLGEPRDRVVALDGPIVTGSSSDGTQLVIASAAATQRELVVCTVSAVGEVKWTRVPETNSGLVSCVTCSDSGDIVVLGRSDGGVDLVKCDAASQPTQLRCDDWVTDVAVDTRNARIAAAAGQRVRVWDLQSCAESIDVRVPSGSVRRVAFDPNRALVAIGDNAGAVRLYDTNSGRLCSTLECGNSGITSLRFAGAVDAMLVGTDDGGTWLWRF